jgi:hypothetical protein
MAAEVEPLLRSLSDDFNDVDASTNNPADPAPASPPSIRARVLDHLRKWKTIYIMCVFVFVVDFPEFARTAPSLRLFEQAVCREYYRDHDASVIGADGAIASDLCKAKPVQQRLATLKGILGFLGVIPGKPKISVSLNTRPV